MSQPSPLSPPLIEQVEAFILAGERGELAASEMKKLENILRDNPQARRFYASYILETCRLRDWAASASNTLEPSSDLVGIGHVAFGEQSDIAVESVAKVGFSTILHGSAGYFASGWPVAYLVATVFLGVGILIGSLVHVSQPVEIATQPTPLLSPSPTTHYPLSTIHSSVGRITGMVDCQWAGSLPSPAGGRGAGGEGSLQLQSPVHLHDRFALASGLMEITYTTGARVILQGPCTYEVESKDGGYLSVGKLTARVEKNEERRTKNEELSASRSSFLIPRSYFAVRTPTAVVTDLGTEFGVEVSKDGDTTSHVYRGSVKLRIAGADSETDGNTMVLHENESVQTEKNDTANGPAVTMHRVSADPTTFVRQMIQPPKIIDLLDIVAGGNGTGHHRERGIDPTTGKEDPIYLFENRVGSQAYCPIAWHEMIDGVFVPNGRAGSVQLDSAGHTFDGFPQSIYVVWASVWSWAPQVNRNDEQAKNFKYWIHEMGLNGQYMPDNRGLLDMHPNKGITFDLDAMRKRYPSVRPVRFRAVVGMVHREAMASVWIFVDGQLKLKRTQLRHQDGVVRIDIDIGPGDRFLTIATTDGGKGTKDAWLVLGDPILETDSKE